MCSFICFYTINTWLISTELLDKWMSMAAWNFTNPFTCLNNNLARLLRNLRKQRRA